MIQHVLIQLEHKMTSMGQFYATLLTIDRCCSHQALHWICMRPNHKMKNQGTRLYLESPLKLTLMEYVRLHAVMKKLSDSQSHKFILIHSPKVLVVLSFDSLHDTIFV